MHKTSAKSLESGIRDAACSIRGAKDATKYMNCIFPLIFTKRLCGVFHDELNRTARELGSRKKSCQLPSADHKLLRFYLPLGPDYPEKPVWCVIRRLWQHMHACLNGKVRGSGYAGANKEKSFRRWFVDGSLSKLSLRVETEA